MGLDKWNSRLQRNLEPESTSDVDADERAKEFHERVQTSGAEANEVKKANKAKKSDTTDSKNPSHHLDREE